MAKITVNVDTETSSLDVSIDGELLTNVREVSFYTYDDYYNSGKTVYSRITLVEKNNQNGITKTTNLVAKDSTEGKEAVAAGAKLNKKYREFVELGYSDKVKADILKYFSRP